MSKKTKAHLIKGPGGPILPERHHLRGMSSLLDEHGNVKAQWVKTAKDHEDREELIKHLVANLPKTIKPRKGHIPAPLDELRDDLMAVYPLGDPHVGMLAWAPETGESFDLELAEKITTTAMRNLVLRGPRCKRALVVNLGDFFHYDNAHHHTTAGQHALDVDGRWAKVLDVGLRIMVTLIDTALEHHEEVTVDNRIGNHDAHVSIMLSACLREHYRNEPRVTIPLTTSHRSYYKFGRNLIGVTHGDKTKPEALSEIMAADEPKAWGETKHRLWLTGHIHHRSVLESNSGVRIESFRTLASRDAWHAAQGYHSGRDMHRITIHRDHGEVSRETVNVAAIA